MDRQAGDLSGTMCMDVSQNADGNGDRHEWFDSRIVDGNRTGDRGADDRLQRQARATGAEAGRRAVDGRRPAISHQGLGRWRRHGARQRRRLFAEPAPLSQRHLVASSGQEGHCRRRRRLHRSGGGGRQDGRPAGRSRTATQGQLRSRRQRRVRLSRWRAGDRQAAARETSTWKSTRCSGRSSMARCCSARSRTLASLRATSITSPRHQPCSARRRPCRTSTPSLWRRFFRTSRARRNAATRTTRTRPRRSTCS